MFFVDINLTNGWAITIAIIVASIIYSLFSNIFQLQRDLQKEKESLRKQVLTLENEHRIERNNFNNSLREQALVFEKKDAELKVYYQKAALAEIEKFQQTEVSKIKREAEKQASESAKVNLQEWKLENELKIRKDAISRSQSVKVGKIVEHLIPFHQKFLSQFNPNDATFIGNPIDLIVFDGCSERKDEITIYFVEVKTGRSALKENQRKIKEAV